MAKKPALHNPTSPSVKVDVDGKDYYLKFSFNAICTAEQLTGMNLLVALDFAAIDAGRLRALLYAALLDDQPDMTLESAGALLTLHTAAKITQALTKAFTESHPEPKKDDDSKNVQEPK